MTLKTNRSYISFKTAALALFLSMILFFIIISILNSVFIAFLSAVYFFAPVALLSFIYIVSNNVLVGVKLHSMFKIGILLAIVLIVMAGMLSIWVLQNGQYERSNFVPVFQGELLRYGYVISYFIVSVPAFIALINGSWQRLR